MKRFSMKLLATATFSMIPVTAVDAAPTPPVVTSADLVAHFVADAAFLGLDASNNVTSWTATNDNTIVLTADGSPSSNIVYNPNGLSGSNTGSLVVRDQTGQNRVLRGDIGLTSTLSNATIIWIGSYNPGADGSFDDSTFGQYAYSLGADGAAGSQMDHQTEAGNIELFGGSGTQAGDSIAALNGIDSVWRTDHFGAAPGHVTSVNGIDLNVAADVGYSVPAGSDLQLFGYQNSSATSGGFNFVGNFAEIIIYSGTLDATDSAVIDSYASGRLVPEPSSLALLSLGGLLVARRRRRGARD